MDILTQLGALGAILAAVGAFVWRLVARAEDRGKQKAEDDAQQRSEEARKETRRRVLAASERDSGMSGADRLRERQNAHRDAGER